MKPSAICVLLGVIGSGFLHAGEDDRIALKVLPGFEAEEIYTGAAEDGSWSAMAIDPQGRVVISPQGPEPMLRLTLPAGGGAPKVEKLSVPVTSAMGLLFAFDSLYVNGMGPQGFGLYRLRSSKGGDVFDEVKLLRPFEGDEVGKEHGSHGLALGPDHRLYLAQGNHVPPPKDALPTSPYQHYAEDQLLPTASYGLSSGDRAQAPCGHVLRMDADGGNVEIFAGGLRNIYALDFNEHGDLFTFDSDTEFNWGMPWYVPTRILHLVGGGDYGFRGGSGKWPVSYPDTLPPVVNVGLGCPTGVKFGTTSKFPDHYRNALFVLDWTFGRVLAVHMEPFGASFTGKFETFLQGRPLNLTAIDFGPDGAMYLITGGRKTRSACYRVRSTTAAAQILVSRGNTDLLEQRRALEASVGKAGVEDIWPALGSHDRFLRHTARMALEAQPPDQWRGKALAEAEPHIALTALLALARLGTQEDRAAVIERITWWWPKLQDDAMSANALRVAEVSLARRGLPAPKSGTGLLEALKPSYPSGSYGRYWDGDLLQLLIALNSPDIVPRAMERVINPDEFEYQLLYVFHLRNVRSGWDMEDRKAYFRWFSQPHPAEKHSPDMQRWFDDMHLHYADGGSLKTYLTNIRQEAADNLSPAERKTLEPLLNLPILPPDQPVEVKPHAFVKAWTTEELVPLVRSINGQRSPERGREVFTAALCVACHRYANEGGAVGPDLNAVAYKLGTREMVESIIEPSKVISDQFQNMVVELANGEMRTGRLVKKGKEKVTLSINPFGGNAEEIPRKDIRSLKPSPVSPMPPGLLNNFTQDEILDLLAYLGFGGS